MANSQAENIVVNFNQQLKDFAGKPSFRLERHDEKEPLHEDAEIVEEIARIEDTVQDEDGNDKKVTVQKIIKLQKIPNMLYETAGGSLIQAKKNVKGKKEFKMAALAERIYLADEPIEISLAQAKLIIESVSEIGSRLEKFRIIQLIDPNDSLGLLDDEEDEKEADK